MRMAMVNTRLKKRPSEMCLRTGAMKRYLFIGVGYEMLEDTPNGIFPKACAFGGMTARVFRCITSHDQTSPPWTHSNFLLPLCNSGLRRNLNIGGLPVVRPFSDVLG